MYLLLRNNKQTGPYSLEEIKTIGLKAYDLVWIEGKSAAWRYPCEIDELSAYAPAVEEQPFDRFYKKTSTPVKANANSSAVVTDPASSITESVRSIAEPVTTSSSTPVYSSERPTYGGEPSTIPGKRIIYVTMPAARGPVSTPARETRETPSRESTPRESAAAAVIIADNRGTRETASSTDNRSSRPEPAAPASYPSVAQASAPVYMPENNYIQSPQEDERIEEFLPRRQRRPSRLVRPLVISLTVLAVLAAGIFIGLSINKDSLGLKPGIASSNHSLTPANTQPVQAAPQVQVPVVQHEVTPSVADAKPAMAPTTTNATAPEEKPAAIQKPVTQPNSHPLKTTAQPSKEKAALKNSVASAPTLKDSSAGGLLPHREAAHRTDPDERTGNSDQSAGARATIASQVSASANGYNVGTFGGISGLQVTVSNRSAYPLDVVVVEVQYIQSNKKIYKTENLYFRGIGAGSALMQEAPKSSRGVRVQYKITMISSKELGLSYSGI